MSTIEFHHSQFKSSSEAIDAMNQVKGLINGMDFDGKVFAMSQAYSRWEIDEVLVKSTNSISSISNHCHCRSYLRNCLEISYLLWPVLH